MKPNNRSQGNYRPRDGEQNGARIYQLILNSMQVMPVADISKIALIDNKIVDPLKKGKRKAGGDAAGQRTPKRATTVSKDDTDPESTNTKAKRKPADAGKQR